MPYTGLQVGSGFPAPNILEDAVPDFSGGMNTKSNTDHLMPHESAALINMVPHEGYTEQRPGTVKVGDSLGTDKVTAIDSVKFNNGVSFLVAVCGETLNYWDGTSWAVVQEDGSDLELTDGLDMTFAQSGMADKVFCSNGFDNMRKLSDDGTTEEDTSAPVGKYSVMYGFRVYFTGNTTYPNRVYYSDAFSSGQDPTWNAANYFDVESNDGGVINGLRVRDNRLIIQKTHSTFSYDTVQLVRTASMGGSSQYSMVDTPLGIANIGYGTVTISGGGSINEIGDRIEPTLKGIKVGFVNGVITANYNEACGVCHQNVLYFGVNLTGAGNNNAVLACNIGMRFKPWSVWTGISPGCICVHADAGEEEYVYFGDDTTGTVWKLDPKALSDDATDSPVAIDKVVLTREHTRQDLARMKRCKKVAMTFKNGNTTVKWGYTINRSSAFTDSYKNLLISPISEWDDGGEYWGDGGVWQEEELVEPYWENINKDYRVIQFRFSNNNIGEGLTIYGYTVHYIIKPQRR